MTELLEAMYILPLTDAIIVSAATMRPPTLRSLDAVHVASAVAARVGDRSAVVCG